MKFNILRNIEKEFLTLQLEDILTPKKFETTNSKIRNFSILATNKLNMKIIDEIKIEGFQNFEQYMKINPIYIPITDPEIQTNCYIIQKDLSIDLLVIVYYLVHQLKKIQKLFLSQQMV